MRAAVLIAKGFEEIEAITLIDILRRAGFNLDTISITSSKEVEGGHGVKVITDNIFDNKDILNYDMLILPGGGDGVLNLAAEEKVLNTIREFKKDDKYIAAICAAPFVLDRAGILSGQKITCYPSWKDKINNAKKNDTDVIVDGKIITGRGVGAAIEMSLKIVELINDKNKSEELRKKIVFKI